jgi:protein involved in polysaccharide export with SLBB domain
MTGRRFYEMSIVLGIALTCAALPAFGDDYKLGTSDRLKVKVEEWPELAGEYTVTVDGSVSLPTVGNINAAGLHVRELAKEISDRLQRRANGGERPVAAVEIIQFRPFSIVGDVQRPGDYPYRPGLSVLQAIGIAGGYYRSSDPGLLRLDRDVALAKGDIRTLLLKQNRLVVRASRLTAALAGQQDVRLPPELVNQKDNPAISAIVESERAVLALESDTARSEASALENIKSLYQREIGSLRGQITALTQEKGAIQQQLNDLRSLSAKGLALMPTLFTLERELAQVISGQMSAETAITRAEESITLAEQRLRERALEKSRANTRDLQQTKDEIAEVRARIATASELLNEAQISAPTEARERLAESGQRTNFILVRKDGEVRREIAADETTLVEPGDIIKVPMIVRRPLTASGYTNVLRAETEP